MNTPWPYIAHTYDVAAEHDAATFAGELAGSRSTVTCLTATRRRSPGAARYGTWAAARPAT